ncbi:MAG: NBR1-Ig-like domain-containing protein [Anaerolineae bacterium]|nr:NBR1-Ig-like domain-containing protein [Anaerolineae bacterium]
MISTKRSAILIALTLPLLLAILACGPVATVVVTATPTPQVTCAPLLCPDGQMPFCPGDCPGGCGMVCATPTPTTAALAAATLAATPVEETPPPEPTTAAGCTLGARWVADVTVPDNTTFAPNAPFVKTWRVRNSGTCAWGPGTRLVFVSGDPMGGPQAVEVPALASGAQTDVSVNLVAPATPGTYRANYQFQAPDGTRFGAVIWVQIVVPATPTPVPVCTPMACPTGQVLHCPAATCPGGCGMVCATPTPSGLAILSFTAEVVQDLPPAGKRITFRWRTAGAASAGIWSGTQMRFPKYWDARPPAEGMLTVDVEMTYYRDPAMTLVAKDIAGNEVRASAVVPWACQYAYFFATTERACPAYEASTTWAAEQPFEHGRMIWLQEVRAGSTAYQKMILVFFNNGRFERYQDTWTEAEPESDPSIVPPAGLYQPVRGFGKLWRTDPAIRDRLGWATAPEQGFNTQWQMQMAEAVGVPFYVRRIDGKVIQAGGWDVGSGTWREVP